MDMRRGVALVLMVIVMTLAACQLVWRTETYHHDAQKVGTSRQELVPERSVNEGPAVTGSQESPRPASASKQWRTMTEKRRMERAEKEEQQRQANAAFYKGLEDQIEEIRQKGLKAGGIEGQTWRREVELENLTKQLAVGMSFHEITNLLGKPNQAVMRVRKEGLNDLVGVPLDQLDQPRDNAILVFSPHPQRDYHNMLDDWRILTVYLDANRQLAGWEYKQPPGAW